MTAFKIDSLKFDNRGLIPVIAQDINSGLVLMLAYANCEALEKSIESRQAHYFSRSRNEIWHKGATSGHIQYIKDIRYDCDFDAVLYMVQQTGAACHTGEISCFYRSVFENTGKMPDILSENTVLKNLQNTIASRKSQPKEKSYTNYLFDKGIDKILKKVGEESAEVIIASKNGNKEEITYETADLIYHLTVMLVEKNLEWRNIMDELKSREPDDV